MFCTAWSWRTLPFSGKRQPGENAGRFPVAAQQREACRFEGGERVARAPPGALEARLGVLCAGEGGGEARGHGAPPASFRSSLPRILKGRPLPLIFPVRTAARMVLGWHRARRAASLVT